MHYQMVSYQLATENYQYLDAGITNNFYGTSLIGMSKAVVKNVKDFHYFMLDLHVSEIT